MKPKKRQPLDFSATPTEVPPEEPKTAPELSEPTSFALSEEEPPSAEPLTLSESAPDDLVVPTPATVRSRRRREPEPVRFAEPDMSVAKSLAATAAAACAGR